MNTLVNVLLWATYILSVYFAIFWFLVLLDKGVAHERKRIKRFPKVTIAIPAWNEEENIEATIKSALSLNYPKEKLEIIAIDHGSSDNTFKKMQKYKEKIKILKIARKNEERKGAPMNAALKIASGDIFVCLDADSIPEKDALLKMVPYFEEESVGCVLPLMKVAETKTFWQKVQKSEYIVNMFYKRIMSKLNAVHVAPGPFSAFRTNALRKIGGYDTKNLTEDLEVTYKLQKSNYKIIQLLNVKVLTKAPKNFIALYKQRNRWFKGAFLNTLKYRKLIFNRNYGDFGTIQLPTVIISGILAIILLLTTSYYALKPHIDFFFNTRLVGFDIWTLIKNFTIDFNILDLNYALVFSMAIMFLLSVIILKLSHKHCKEKMLRPSIVAFIFFFIYYYLILGIAWLGVLFDIIIGRNAKW